MPVIGLDFGSHHGSIALFHEGKEGVEVIADDLGSRAIPCAVAFRGSEIITGQAAVGQQHKNPSNTFDDLRTLLFSETTTVHVPGLEKDMPVTELVSHFFRNIHNQIKQQVGKPVRETVLSIPSGVSEAVKARLVESAQAGGIRIKSFIEDTAATILAYGVIDFPTPAKVLVVDIGWSRSQVAVFSVSGGAISQLSAQSSEAAGGKVFVNLLADHCAKEFQRKAKFPCSDNARAMLRLRRECESAVKALSTGAEATIDIDSLCEGVDFSCKVSRARFEDLCSAGFVQIKNITNECLASAGASITHVCVSGGLSAVPKVSQLIKTLLPDAVFPKVRLEPSEAQCTGAALHAMELSRLGLLDNAPTASPTLPCLKKAVLIGGAEGPLVVAVPVGSVVPCSSSIKAAVSAEVSSFLRVSVAAGDDGTGAVAVGEIVFSSLAGSSAVEVKIEVAADGAINASVLSEGAAPVVLGTLAIPSK